MTEPDQSPKLNHPDIRNQQILVISSLFPPDVLGGAEMSAYNLAHWLRKRGATVGVLTTAKTPDEAHDGKDIDGLKIWRVWMPRFYSKYHAARAPWWQKPFWHLQDHFDPRNRRIVARVLEEFKPTHINIHLLQGIGANVLLTLAQARISTTFFLHDLGLACFRMGMFKKGRACTGQCLPCKISSAYKQRCTRRMPDMQFISPSRANLETLARYFPIKNWTHAVIPNANQYPAATVSRSTPDHVRLLYVGRLHQTKGVDLLLQAASALASQYSFTLTIVGSGPDESRLRQTYADQTWCHFTGFVTQQEISNHMVNSDILCVPSIWAENSPGVVIHALSLGLPVVGSDKAGIPELVQHRQNGLLVAPGDQMAWQKALAEILQNPSMLEPLRESAIESAHRFDQDHIGQQLLQFMYAARG